MNIIVVRETFQILLGKDYLWLIALLFCGMGLPLFSIWKFDDIEDGSGAGIFGVLMFKIFDSTERFINNIW